MNPVSEERVAQVQTAGLKVRKTIAQGKASPRATPWVNRPQNHPSPEGAVGFKSWILTEILSELSGGSKNTAVILVAFVFLSASVKDGNPFNGGQTPCGEQPMTSISLALSKPMIIACGRFLLTKAD